jgi:DNA-binding CsgD family transcriptional regulator
MCAQLVEVTSRSVSRRLPGFVLVDAEKNPVCYNAEAVRILAELSEGAEAPRNGGVPRGKALTALVRRALSRNDAGVTEFTSGKMRYRCWTFSVFQDAKRPTDAFTGLLIEPSKRNDARESEVAEKFHLSKREEETVSLLTLGLTSKEIATRMGVSPNTIKVFLRLIMTKMAVGTRSGIVGKLLQN